MLNILTDPWLPARRRSGARDTIRPAQITESHDPVMALDWPRADFRIAGLEFLIGLLATACPPTSFGSWQEGWEAPPEPTALDAAFALLVPAFALDGPGPRFLQDAEELVSDAEPIEGLLIEAPGASTKRQNTDLLVRRDRVAALGRPAAAMALFTFQSWAPAGGAGNRTGLRGGGPMTTLVLPVEAPTLWQLLWANVPRGEPAETEDFPRIFPWLARNPERDVHPEADAHPLQCWWGMPRRIRLDFAVLDHPAPCGLTNVTDGVQVRSWRQRPRGSNYVGWGRIHPLSPHYTMKAGGEFLPLHPQPGGIGYRHWLGLVMASPDGLRLPAAAVTNWRNGRELDAGLNRRAGLLVAGYDMDNMKARAFLESEMPLPATADAARRAAQDALAARLVTAANHVAGLLRSAVRYALFSAGATVKIDAQIFASLRESFWERTEADFIALLNTAPADAGKRWLARLRPLALALFDEAAPLTPENGAAAPRIGAARRNLVFALTGFGKEGVALFGELGLDEAQPKGKKKGKAA